MVAVDWAGVDPGVRSLPLRSTLSTVTGEFAGGKAEFCSGVRNRACLRRARELLLGDPV